jgi:hypothetical protein
MENYDEILTVETRKTRGKTCPSKTFPPQIPYGLTHARTQDSAVEVGEYPPKNGTDNVTFTEDVKILNKKSIS